MIANFIRNIYLSLLALLIMFYPIRLDALSHDWVTVPKSPFGEQLWDKSSVKKNQDGSLRVFSKFIPTALLQITASIGFLILGINLLTSSNVSESDDS